MFFENRYPLFEIMLQQFAEKLSVVIPEAAKRLSGIHTPGRKDAEIQGLWIPGSGRRPAPE
jgi:hypothetical protein